MGATEALLLDMLVTVFDLALALASVGRTQILPYHALLAALHGTPLTAAVANAEPHAALDIGAALGLADAAAAVGDTQPFALRTARAAFALATAPATMADAEPAGHSVARTPRERAQLFLTAHIARI